MSSRQVSSHKRSAYNTPFSLCVFQSHFLFFPAGKNRESIGIHHSCLDSIGNFSLPCPKEIEILSITFKEVMHLWISSCEVTHTIDSKRFTAFVNRRYSSRTRYLGNGEAAGSLYADWTTDKIITTLTKHGLKSCNLSS